MAIGHLLRLLKSASLSFRRPSRCLGAAPCPQLPNELSVSGVCQILDCLKSNSLSVVEVAAEGGSRRRISWRLQVAKVDYIATVGGPECDHTPAAHHPGAADTIVTLERSTIERENPKILSGCRGRQDQQVPSLYENLILKT
jgi:hypothetical protein